MTETHELAVMCDTFNPLQLTTLARDLDDGQYASPGTSADRRTRTRPAGVTSHL